MASAIARRWGHSPSLRPVGVLPPAKPGGGPPPSRQAGGRRRPTTTPRALVPGPATPRRPAGQALAARAVHDRLPRRPRACRMTFDRRADAVWCVRFQGAGGTSQPPGWGRMSSMGVPPARAKPRAWGWGYLPAEGWGRATRTFRQRRKRACLGAPPSRQAGGGVAARSEVTRQALSRVAPPPRPWRPRRAAAARPCAARRRARPSRRGTRTPCATRRRRPARKGRSRSRSRRR